MNSSYTNPSVEEVSIRRSMLAGFDGWNERAFAALVAWMGIPESYLDVGSGTGAMVNMARKMGIEAYGVDVINGPEHWFVHHDLTIPVQFVIVDGYIKNGIEDYYSPKLKADLITCVEVAEHIPAVAAATLVETINRHLKYEGILVFSAAPPGQNGEHHVNCQPATYWRDLFYDVGISYRENLTAQLSHIWSWIAGPMSWLGANVQVFDK